MPGDVARERGRHEGRQLVRQPVHGADPAHAAALRRRVLGVASPGAHEGLSVPALDEAGDEGEPVVRREVADHRDRAHGVVVALRAPGGDGRIVHGPVEREVELDVPFEAVELAAGAADPVLERRRVGHVVRDGVPVARRRLRVWAVRPELGQGPREVATADTVGRVRLPGDRVAAVPWSVIRPERVGASGAGADVDRGAVGRIEPAAVADDVDGHPLVHLVAELRRPARVERQPLRRQRQGEPLHVPPVGPDEPLHAARDRHPVLRDLRVEGERLPAVRVVQGRSRLLDDEGLVHGLVLGVHVALLLQRAVVPAVGDHGGGDPVPERRGRVAVHRRRSRPGNRATASSRRARRRSPRGRPRASSDAGGVR